MVTQTSDNILSNPRRLAILRALSLLDTPREAHFDHLTVAAARSLHTPVALMSLVESHRQWYKSLYGLPLPLSESRQTDLSFSICQYVVTDRRPLVVSDLRRDPRLRTNRAVTELGFTAYLGAPLVVQGELIGSFCVMDVQPRDWSSADIETVISLANVAAALAKMRAQIATLFEVAGDELPIIDDTVGDDTQKAYRELIDSAHEQTHVSDALHDLKPATQSRRPRF